MSCKPFSVTLAVLAPDNKRQISFGITKGCISDDQAFYVLNFVLRDLVNGDFQDRVSCRDQSPRKRRTCRWVRQQTPRRKKRSLPPSVNKRSRAVMQFEPRTAGVSPAAHDSA